MGNIPAEQAAQHDPGAVGGKVEPVAAAVGRAGGLQYFDNAAHQDGQRDADKGNVPSADTSVAAQVFEPDDYGQPAIHTDMHHFVEVGNLSHIGFRRSEKRQVTDGEYDDDG